MNNTNTDVVSKLLSQGGYGCVYYPGITCEGTTEMDTKVITKLQKTDDAYYNELDIGEYIKDNIKYYKKLYAPVLSGCDINLSQVKIKGKNECKVIEKYQYKRDVKFGVMKIPYIQGMTFYDHIKSHTTGDNPLWSTSKTVTVFLETYMQLVEALGELYAWGITHYDLKGINIMWDEVNQRPIIIDFGLSKNIVEALEENDLRDIFYVYSSRYTLWAPEIHLMSYVLNERITDNVTTIRDAGYNTNNSQRPLDTLSTFADYRITQTDIETVVNEIVSQNDIYKSLMSNNFMSQYTYNAKEYLNNEFSSNTVTRSLNTIIGSAETWDTYALGIMYLRFISHLTNIDTINDPVILSFSKLLLFTSHPIITKRYAFERIRREIKNIVE